MLYYINNTPITENRLIFIIDILFHLAKPEERKRGGEEERKRGREEERRRGREEE
ncbi:MAG: hypothetical protein AB4290_18935 [Spirulina sp.]